MVRVSVAIDERWPDPPRQLPVCRAHRLNRPNQPPYGFDDMPTRIEGEYRMTRDGSYREWHPRACAYDLAMMQTWGSYKAMLYMKCVDVVDELGLRVGLALATENPDYWP